MKKMKVAVEIDGVTSEYVVTPRAQVEFERQFDMPLSDMARMEQVYFLAYAAMKSAGATSDDYDAWLDTVDAAESIRDDSLPLDPSQSAGS